MNLIENEASRFLSVFQMKSDVLTIMKLVNNLKDGVSQMLIFPYLSLFCHESISYIDKYNATDSSPLSKSIHIQMNRNKLKQYNLSFLKSIKMLNSVDQVQNHFFKSLVGSEDNGMYEFYDNLGVYLNEDIRIVGNTYSCYLFTADKDLSTDISDSKHHFDSGYELGQIFGSINDGLESFLPKLEIPLSSYAPTYYYKDFNTHSANFSSFPTADNGCYLTLLLLHLLSMIGFVNEVLVKIIPHENTWLLKTKYIASYYSIEVLKKAWSFFATNSVLRADQLTMYEDVINKHNHLFNPDFRTCVMHYGFTNKDKFLIVDKYLDLKKPFGGLVESCFCGQSYESYNESISNYINLQSRLLYDILRLSVDDARILH